MKGGRKTRTREYPEEDACLWGPFDNHRPGYCWFEKQREDGPGEYQEQHRPLFSFASPISRITARRNVALNVGEWSSFIEIMYP
jgi:hypothetical protein